LEQIPTHTAPCLTASAAYSIWKILPCGDQVVTSLSYKLRNYKQYEAINQLAQFRYHYMFAGVGLEWIRIK
jgi:hypothetical protein